MHPSRNDDGTQLDVAGHRPHQPSQRAVHTVSMNPFPQPYAITDANPNRPPCILEENEELTLSPIALTPRLAGDRTVDSATSFPSTKPSRPTIVTAFLSRATTISKRLSTAMSNVVESPSRSSRSSLTTLSGALSATDKFTQKWVRPHSLRNLPPGMVDRRRQARGGAGCWSENEMKAALAENSGLGIGWSDRWTPHKWYLLVSVTTVFACGLAGLICALLTWFSAFRAAPFLLISDSAAFVLLTFSSSLLLMASILGLTGTLLNSRPILAVYVLILFPAFISFVSIGYLTYRKSIYSLDGKMSEAWNDWYSYESRTVIQSALACCGWVNALHNAAPSGTCYARTPLPGCRGPLLAFEREMLRTIYGAVFALVPLHILNIIVGLLCANHVTRRFGKGLMPRRYRLHLGDVAILGGSRASSRASSACSSIRTVELGVPRTSARATTTGTTFFREDRVGMEASVSTRKWRQGGGGAAVPHF